MSTLNELLARAQEVRDEQEVGGNTALRVGQLLADIIQWCADTDADFVESVEHYVAQLNERDGIINWWQSRILILKTMGSDFDDVDVSSLSNGDLYYDSVGKWLFERENGGSVNGHHPSGGVLYVNIGNGMSYRWDGSTMRAIRPDDVWDAIQNLRDNVDMILAALGNYAFPGGKPTTDWSGGVVEFSVTYPTDEKVTHSGAGDTVELGSSLEVTLGTNDDLYVIKESSVKVYMGSNEVTGAYDPTTDTITINNVVGNVVIVAEAWTYFGYNDGNSGLELFLDGKHGRSVSHRWDSLVNYNNNPIFFKLENCDESHDDYVAGISANNSKGLAYSDVDFLYPITTLDVPQATGTIEAAFNGTPTNDRLVIMHNGNGNANRILLAAYPASGLGSTETCIVNCNGPSTQGLQSAVVLNKTDISSIRYISAMKNSFIVNGVEKPVNGNYYAFSSNGNSVLSIFYRHVSDEASFDYKLYALRVYSVQLTDAERAQNLAIDQKRFNLEY